MCQIGPKSPSSQVHGHGRHLKHPIRSSLYAWIISASILVGATLSNLNHSSHVSLTSLSIVTGSILVDDGALALIAPSRHLTSTTDSIDMGETRGIHQEPTNDNINPRRPQSLVCVIGNAESIQLADTVRQRLGSFPSAWACWNCHASIDNGGDDNDHGQETKVMVASSTFVVETCRDNCHWAKGIEVALKLARQHYDCEYFFLADDDSEYSLVLTGGGRSTDPTAIREELQRVLDHYKPAVAALPWPYGHNSSTGMAQINELYSASDVSPLTGFDNGNLFLHQSIADFFIPVSPRGEGGWWGNWTLPASYLQMIIPPLFRENAIEIRTVRYHNGINLNSNPNKTGSYIQDGLYYTHSSRHPYEFPLKKEYEKFLFRGYKAGTRFGAQLLASDVKWTPQVGKPPYDQDLLQKMNAIYDLEHPAVAEKAYFVNTTTQQQRLDMRRNTPYTIKLMVFTYNRLSSLKRLIRSLQYAYYKGINFDARNVALVIHIDYSDEQATMIEYAESISWPFGPKEIVIQSRHRGLKESIMSSWIPSNMDEYAVFLEDDVEVSPFYFHWIHAGLRNFFYGETGELNPNLLGLSLYQPIWSQVNNSKFFVNNGNKPYILQLPCSWGAVYFPRPWMKFLTYMDNFKGDDWDLQIPDSLTNRWPGRKSWKKYLIRKMIDENWFMIYPNIPGNYALSTNHLGIGENEKLKGSELAIESSRYTVPLLQSKDINDPNWLEEWFNTDDLKMFNVYHQEVKRLEEFTIDHSPFEKFTIIVPTFNRTEILVETIAHYAILPDLDQIIVVWNNIGETPPKLPKFAVPVKIQVMEKNALSNRFMPLKSIRTSAILSIDDDMRIDLDDVTRGFQAWQRNCFQLVGWNFTTRGTTIRDGELVYDNSVPLINNTTGRTIVLTGGAFFHAKYLHHYTNDQRFSVVRDIVERLHNCEDIGFNFMVAALIRLPPVVVVGSFNKTLASGVEGLWKKPGHFDKRSSCIREFMSVYGNATLMQVKAMQYPLRGQSDLQGDVNVQETVPQTNKMVAATKWRHPLDNRGYKTNPKTNANPKARTRAKTNPVGKSYAVYPKPKEASSKSDQAPGPDIKLRHPLDARTYALKTTSMNINGTSKEMYEIPKILLLAADRIPEIKQRVERIQSWQSYGQAKVVKKMIERTLVRLREYGQPLHQVNVTSELSIVGLV